MILSVAVASAKTGIMLLGFIYILALVVFESRLRHFENLAIGRDCVRKIREFKK